MFGAQAAVGIDSGNTSERSFTSRFGAGANNIVSSSIDVTSHKFLGQSMQGSKNLLGTFA